MISYKCLPTVWILFLFFLIVSPLSTVVSTEESYSGRWLANSFTYIVKIKVFYKMQSFFQQETSNDL